MNLAYFHRQCHVRLSRNHISEIFTKKGVSIKGQALLKLSTSKHFQLLFQDDGLIDEEVSSEYLDNVPSLVNAEDNDVLVKPFSEKEIVDVIWAMEPDKAPGLDGFSIHFYRFCWQVIKSNLFHMISAFLKKAKVGGCTRSTLLALIPKEVNPTSFDSFQPISLCNTSYKILAKLLANRLKPMLENLISPRQGGLLKEGIL